MSTLYVSDSDMGIISQETTQLRKGDASFTVTIVFKADMHWSRKSFSKYV